MLQFITSQNDKYSIVEQVKIALEAGCKWIELCMENASTDDIRATTEELIPMCKEVDAILVIDDYVDIAKELEITGVHLSKRGINIAEARNTLEGGPIIGVSVRTAGDIYALKGIDVDYVTLGPDLELDAYRKIVNEVRKAGVELPIVAYGDINIDNISDIMSTGVNGIAMGAEIINASNPTEYIKNVLEILYK